MAAGSSSLRCALGAVGLVVVLLASSIPAIGGGSTPLVRSPAPRFEAGSPTLSAFSNGPSGSVSGDRAPVPSAPSAVRPANHDSTNSSAVIELRGVVQSVAVGAGAYSTGYDPSDGYVYVGNLSAPWVANPTLGDDEVTVLDGNQTIGSVRVGEQPSGFTYDPSDGDMYVADLGSNDVSVIQGMRVVATITDPSLEWPSEGAYDPSNGCVYFANLNGASVTVINGTRVVGSVAVGQYPIWVTYYPPNQDMYVANDASVSNGGSNLSLVNNLTVVGTLDGDFTNPSGIAYDPQNGYLYVGNKNIPDPMDSYVTVVDREGVVATITTGQDIFGVAYDPAAGVVLAASSDNDLPADENPNTLSIINGTTLEGNLTVGVDSHFMDYDSDNEEMYVANGGDGSAGSVSLVEFVPGLLGESALSLTPSGTPPGTMDVGQNVQLNSTLWALGTPADLPSLSVRPYVGLGCQGSLSVLTTRTSAALSTHCTPTAPGNYTAWINVTDSTGAMVWAQANLLVFQDPSITAPTANRTSADVGQRVNFRTTIRSEGDGNASLVWLESAGLTCTPTSSPILSCTVNAPGDEQASVTLTDGNGEVASGRSGTLVASTDPTVPAPTLTPTTTDVGLKVNGSVTPSGGSGGYIYNWLGLPKACTGSEMITCVPATSGSFVVSVIVKDSNGFAVTSPTTDLLVNPALAATAITGPTGTPTAGEVLTFSVLSTGGSNPVTYAWVFGDHGTASGAWVNHSYTLPGTHTVWVWINDSAGGSISRSFVVPVGPASSAPAPSGPAPRLFGLPGLEGYGLLGGVALAFLAGVLAVHLWERRKNAPPSAPTPPPEPDNPTEAAETLYGESDRSSPTPGREEPPASE